MHPRLYWFVFEGVKPTISGTFDPFGYSTVSVALFVIVPKQLAMKFINTVPTIEQSGIYANVPAPFLAIY